MVKVNSILTDYSMTKLAALVARTEQTAPHLVELALDALEADLNAQAEYDVIESAVRRGAKVYIVEPATAAPDCKITISTVGDPAHLDKLDDNTPPPDAAAAPSTDLVGD